MKRDLLADHQGASSILEDGVQLSGGEVDQRICEVGNAADGAGNEVDSQLVKQASKLSSGSITGQLSVDDDIEWSRESVEVALANITAE